MFKRRFIKKEKNKEDLFTETKVEKLLSGELSFENYSMEEIKKNKILQQIGLWLYGITLFFYGIMLIRRPFWYSMYVFYLPFFLNQYDVYNDAKSLVEKYQEYLEEKEEEDNKRRFFNPEQLELLRVRGSRPVSLNNSNNKQYRIVDSRKYFRIPTNNSVAPIVNNQNNKSLTLKFC